jgi:SAM-dependent methyltransferase
MRNINLDEERKFQNRKASGEMMRASQGKFYWAIEIPFANHKKNTFKAINGKKILEVGCASGYDAVEYCKYAETYIGVDISNVAIDDCNLLSIKNAKFYCTDGHKLPSKDKSVDFVIVNALLHHMDLETVFKEISRVLKVNGAIIFNEPLGTNPIFQLYRKLTPKSRTVDERPFTFNDLRLFQKYFLLEKDTQWFGFLSIISAYVKLSQIRLILTCVDRYLSYTPLKYFFWYFSGIAKLRAK